MPWDGHDGDVGLEHRITILVALSLTHRLASRVETDIFIGACLI